MRFIVLSVFMFHSLFSFEYTLTPHKISETITCFFGKPEIMNKHNNGDMTNSCYVDLGKSYLVIDSGPSYNYAKSAHKTMNRVKKQKVSHVINTHIHDDHWLGNGYYKNQGAELIGAEIFANTPKSTTIRMEQHISKEAFSGTSEVFPTRIIKESKTITLEGIDIELQVYNHPTHSENDLIVFIPKYSVVFAGDLVFNERILSLRDGDINNWLNVLEEIKSKQSKYIIGGHGSAYKQDSINMTIKYLTEVKKFVRNAIDNGLDITDTLAICDMPEFQELKLYDIMHRQNIETAFRTLEWSDD